MSLLNSAFFVLHIGHTFACQLVIYDHLAHCAGTPSPIDTASRSQQAADILGYKKVNQQRNADIVELSQIDSYQIDAGATPPALDKIKLAEYLKGGPSIINRPDPASGPTPLAVIRKGNSSTVKLLLDNGANPDTKTQDGRTPKQWARMIQLLLAKNLALTSCSLRKGGLITYINEEVLKVLAYFDIWSPLIVISDAASRTYYKLSGSNPAPGEDIAEHQRVEDFKNNLNNLLLSLIKCKRGGLEKFFPPNDPYLTDVAKKAFELKNDPKNPLNSPSQVDGLAKLALYQPILYRDDSGSMCSVENGQGKGDRWRAQIELVKRISSIASRIDPLNRVCHPRFINKQTPDANGLTKYQVEQRIQSFYPEDWTPIGTKLRENVLDPFIYKDVGAEKAGKGGSTGKLDENENEDMDRFRKEIHECAMKFENSKDNYRKDSSQIRKNISYVEDELKAKAYLDGLEYDVDIQDVLLYRTAELMDSRYEELRENEKDLERWLLSTLLSPLQSLYN
ncbi:uncharacterized protein F4817DRAFT_359830 [Daldinia loculata]|uniref:uncharacterized protein n=1 Tax=Daldinia loculata TaxID=103429 RepID=UPI0020C26504|nr:uncharacterized protein F4817DRAFT_359830 [Daldinia loculata]KAI1645874.1 hypothetical protein F4817DRAFT_359830 [Daldinia loculata]